MARVELPVITQPMGNGTVRRSVAVEHPRDAYRDVPILQEPTWAREIATYFYLGGVSAGAAILGALTNLVGGADRQPLARTAHYVAFATMLPCPALLIADLGKPSRFHHMLRIFKPSSPMNFGAWVLTAYGGLETLAALRALAGEHDLPLIGGPVKLLPEAVPAALSLPFALGLGGYTGVLIGTTSVPAWYTSQLIGALFMAGALSTGVAATGLVASCTGREGPADRQAITSIEEILGLAEIALEVGYVATTGPAIKPLLRGSTGTMLAAGTTASVAAIALLEMSARMPARGTMLRRVAAGLTLAGGALLRFSIVLGGKRSAKDREGTLRAMAPSARAPGWMPARRRRADDTPDATVGSP